MEDIPENVIKKFGLKAKEEYGQVYVKIRKGIYDLPQAGILAQKLLEKRFKKKGYYQSMYKPVLWLHEWQPIQFHLVVDDFEVKYVFFAHIFYSKIIHYERELDGSPFMQP